MDLKKRILVAEGKCGRKVPRFGQTFMLTGGNGGIHPPISVRSPIYKLMDTIPEKQQQSTA